HTRCLSDWSSDVCSSDLPSRDHRGAAVCVAPMEVSRMALDPSGLANHISASPERVDWKATRCPSGENWAMLSTRVEEIASPGGRSEERRVGKEGRGRRSR